MSLRAVLAALVLAAVVIALLGRDTPSQAVTAPGTKGVGRPGADHGRVMPSRAPRRGSFGNASGGRSPEELARRSFSITGTVVDGDGVPIAGASVSPFGLIGDGTPDGDAVTDDEGAFGLEIDVPYGGSMGGFVTAYGEDGQRGHAAVYLSAEQPLAEVSIVLRRPARIDGVVRSQGRPVAFALVEIACAAVSDASGVGGEVCDAPAVTVTSDTAGRFTAEVDGAGLYLLTARVGLVVAEGYAQIVDDHADTVVEVPATAVFVVQVRDAQGQPLAGVAVRPYCHAAEDEPPLALTDARGEARVAVAGDSGAGHHEMCLSKPGYASLATATSTADQPTQVTLAKATRAHGVVVSDFAGHTAVVARGASGTTRVDLAAPGPFAMDIPDDAVELFADVAGAGRSKLVVLIPAPGQTIDVGTLEVEARVGEVRVTGCRAIGMTGLHLSERHRPELSMSAYAGDGDDIHFERVPVGSYDLFGRAIEVGTDQVVTLTCRELAATLEADDGPGNDDEFAALEPEHGAEPEPDATYRPSFELLYTRAGILVGAGGLPPGLMIGDLITGDPELFGPRGRVTVTVWRAATRSTLRVTIERDDELIDEGCGM